MRQRHGTDPIVIVLIVATAVAVFGAGYLGAHRATRTTRAQPTAST